MRIFGGHDYYDGALAYGRDETLVFERRPAKTAEVLSYRDSGLTPERGSFSFQRDRKEGWNRWGEIERGRKRYMIKPAAVWFAGKRYGGASVRTFDLRSHYLDNASYVWDEERFKALLDSIGVELARPSRWFASERDVDSGDLHRHFSREPTREELDWLIESRTSIAVWQEATNDRNSSHWHQNTGWKVNVDGLGKIGFASRLDPFTAFQELSMWIGGVLPREANPMVEIHDEKTKVRKHGMDEWSFRTPPVAR
mgnify:CR=1 FL=1